jgi:hypothetical protein
MMSWKTRLGLVLTMFAMLLAVSVPAVADHDDDLCDFDGDDSVSEEEAEECAEAIEDSLPSRYDVEVLCEDDDDGDGWFDEDGDDDGEDDDEDGWVDEDDDCDDPRYVISDEE